VTYVLPEHAIVNPDDNNLVALKHKKKNRVIVNCSDRNHVFHMRANICMTWVPLEDVQCCLDKTSSCCGGRRKKGAILFANESDVRRWTNRGGR